MVLLVAAMGHITKPVHETKLHFYTIDLILTDIEGLNVINSRDDRQKMTDFLILFQSFQNLKSLMPAQDESIRHILAVQPEQMDQFRNHLKSLTERLNKSIRIQQDLHENTAVR